MAKAPVHSIVETLAFTARVKRLGVSKEELATIYDTYASNPEYGQIVRRTGGLRKGRIARDAGGKSGGYRVFSFYGNAQGPVFLLWLIDKTEDDTLTDAQENAFKSLTALLKTELRT